MGARGTTLWNMTPDEVLVALIELAGRLGVRVRIEPFELRVAGRGGLCRVDGRAMILVDAKLAKVDQVGVVGEALGALRPLDVPASLRSYLERGHGRVRALVALRPLARARA